VPVSVLVLGLGLLAAFALAAAAVPAAARTGELQSVRAQAKALAADVGALDAQIGAAVQRRTRASSALAAVRGQISDNQRQQTLALRELDLASAMLAARAVALYKQDDVTTLDAIFSADDFSDLVSQLTMVQSIARSDRNVLRTVEHTKRELADRAVSLVADERTAKRLVAKRDAELKNIKTQLGDRQALLAGVRQEIRDLAARQTPATPKPDETVKPPSDDGDSGGGGGGGGQGQWWQLIQQAAGSSGVSARGMYRLMMIESGGYASIVGPGGYYGLFQYHPATWKGSWNPYRSASITDGAAQIRATALALKMGYGHAWWDPSYSWAFSGR
jgi:peptidoglycan hydrolase CwlO-like protein